MKNDKDGAALLREAIHNALSSELGDTYDCGRVWDAWHVGTMGEDDFTPVNDRVGEITETVLAALKSHGQAFDAAEVREACANVAESWVKCDYSEECNILAGSIAEAPASVVDREITTKPVAVGETAAGVTQGAASVEPVAKVPAFATEEMVEAGLKTGSRYGATAMRNIWREMYMAAQSARPEPDTIGSHFGNGGGLDPVRACGCPECEASPGFGGGDLREAVAVALWKREAERAAPNVAKGRNAVTFHDQLECEKGKWLGLADAALAALPPVKQSVGKFQRGDHVEKVSGSNWRGKVVGEYSTDLTPEGYAVESDTETGSVQIYPAKALRLSHDQRGGSGE